MNQNTQHLQSYASAIGYESIGQPNMRHGSSAQTLFPPSHVAAPSQFAANNQNLSQGMNSYYQASVSTPSLPQAAYLTEQYLEGTQIPPDLVDSVTKNTMNTLYSAVGPALKNVWEQIRRTVISSNLQYALTIEKLRKELELSRASEKVATAKHEDALKKAEEYLQAAKNYRDGMIRTNVEFERVKTSYEVVKNYALVLAQQLNARQNVNPTQSSHQTSSSEELHQRIRELEKKLKTYENSSASVHESGPGVPTSEGIVSNETEVDNNIDMFVKSDTPIQADSSTREGDDHDNKACAVSSDIVEDLVIPNIESSESTEVADPNSSPSPVEKVTSPIEVTTGDAATLLDQTAISATELGHAEKAPGSTLIIVGESGKRAAEDELDPSSSKRPRMDTDVAMAAIEESHPELSLVHSATEIQISCPNQEVPETSSSKDNMPDAFDTPVLPVEDDCSQAPVIQDPPETSLPTPEAPAQHVPECVQQLDELHFGLIYRKSLSDGEQICRLCCSFEGDDDPATFSPEAPTEHLANHATSMHKVQVERLFKVQRDKLCELLRNYAVTDQHEEGPSD